MRAGTKDCISWASQIALIPDDTSADLTFDPVHINIIFATRYRRGLHNEVSEDRLNHWQLSPSRNVRQDASPDEKKFTGFWLAEFTNKKLKATTLVTVCDRERFHR